MHLEFDVAESDDARDEVRAFMSRLLGPRSGLQIPSIADERQVGAGSSLILTVRMNGHLVGALYGSADIEFASLFANAGRRRVGRLFLRRVFVIHQIAVAPGQRRVGIGRELVAGALQAATTGGAWVTVLSFDSAHNALPSFYEAVGLTVLEPGQILGMKFRGVLRMIGMSLDTPGDAWAFVVLDPARARARALRRRLQTQ